ncbi:MAG: glycosyltransferase family 39 protein [Chloroflexi bacterium]|nr:glycosyltransferase family 39 protein [Chloroflexota bacterium]
MSDRLWRRVWSPTGLMLVLVFIAFSVRVYRLDWFALRGDESFTVQFSQLPADELLAGVRYLEPNPPVLYYSLRGWMLLAGDSEFSSRFYSVFFGVLSVPLMYALGRALGGRQVGLLAAVIVAVNPFQIWHSQDVRNYTLWPTLTLAAWYFLWRAIQHRRRRDWAAYVILTVTALMTHYYQLFISVAENLFVVSWLVAPPDGVSRGLRWSLAKAWLVAQGVVAAVFVAWVLFGMTTAFAAISNGSSPTFDQLLLRTLAAVTIGDTVPKQAAVWLMLPALILIVVGAVTLIRSRPHAARWLLLGVGVPLAATFVASRLRPLYETRYLNQTAPFYYLLAAIGLAALLDRRRMKPLAVVLAAAWLVIGSYTYGLAQFDRRYAKSPDWRARAAYLERHQQPGDVIIQNYPDPSLSYYYHGAAPLHNLPTGYLDQARRLETEEQLRRYRDDYRRIWLLPQINPVWDLDGAVERILAQTTDRVWSGTISESVIQLYETSQALLPSVRPLDVTFEAGFRLSGYRLIGEQARPGDAVHVTLLWQAERRQTFDYTVFVHVLDAGGRLQAQQDNAPVRGLRPTSQWTVGETIIDGYDLVIPDGLPAGEYTIEVGLYDWQTLIRQRTHTGDERVVLSTRIRVDN